MRSSRLGAGIKLKFYWFHPPQAVLVLCRGLFTPGHNDAASRVHDNVYGAALRPQADGYSLAASYAQVSLKNFHFFYHHWWCSLLLNIYF